jgi:4-carboxymuconolactone decarboxylase
MFDRKETTMRALLLIACIAALICPSQMASTEEAARFAPLKADQLTPEQKAWAEAISAPPRNANFANPPYRAYIRAPELAKRLSSLSDYVRWNTSLPPRLSELAILIAAREWTAQYEWFAHYPLAIKGGLAPNIAGDIAAGKRPEGMKDDEAALYDLTTQLYHDRNVSDAAYQAALHQFGERGVMEIISIIGYYDLVSMTLITMRAEPPNNTVAPLPPLQR